MRTWTQELECKIHGITYEFECRCAEPNDGWCDCDECPACAEEQRAIDHALGMRDQARNK